MNATNTIETEDNIYWFSWINSELTAIAIDEIGESNYPQDNDQLFDYLGLQSEKIIQVWSGIHSYNSDDRELNPNNNEDQTIIASFYTINAWIQDGTFKHYLNVYNLIDSDFYEKIKVIAGTFDLVYPYNAA